MIKLLQRFLLLLGVLALLAVLVDIGVSIAATVPVSTPARVLHVLAGPYPLKVSLYRYPANAGYALPIAIEAEPATSGALQFAVSSLPGKGVDATPVQGSFSSTGPASIRGVVEITVQGLWNLHIIVNGPAGQGVVDVPILATVPPVLPAWSGWLLGLAPLFGLLIFLLIQWKNTLAAPPASSVAR